jgi:GntR family transcriptional regulator, carbon starvation induced regulator
MNIAALPLDTDLAIPSATHQTYLAIRELVLNGDIRPGEKLKIGDLKLRLNAGASPIREALSLLTSDQLVERIDQRGFRCAPTSQKNFDDILTLRCALEEMALRQSIAHASSEWEEKLVLIHHRLAKARREDRQQFEDTHKSFHMTLLENCQSPLLLRYCSQLYDLNVRYRNLAGRSETYGSRDVAQEHRMIFEAAIRLEADNAAEHLLSHYRQTGDFLRADQSA